MANKPPQIPEQISYFSLNDLRKELDAKIDTKISTTIFCWIIGVLVLVLLAVLGTFFSKLEGVQTHITVLETKSNSHIPTSK